MDSTAQLIRAFKQQFQTIETHLSIIVLTGEFAYKIKKPLNLGFNDFTTLEKRKYYCEKEILYNALLAKELYVGVVAVTGSYDAPLLEGKGEPLEYAVKMHQFPQEALFSYLIKENQLKTYHIENIAEQVAAFHQKIPSTNDEALAKPDFTLMQANFDALRSLSFTDPYMDEMIHIEKWASRRFLQIEPLLKARKKQGYVRACHGDLHLNNIVMINARGIIFDCIEFNEELRWIDVINEIAFLAMDLDYHQRPDFASLFINQYLEMTGDYAGMTLLRFYQCYRAMVRAKIAAIEFQQSQDRQFLKEFSKYLSLAKSYTLSCQPKLTLTCGPSGSGKTLYSGFLLQQQFYIRVRSDIVRKKFYSHLANKNQHGLYSQDITQKVYRALAEIAQILLEAKLSVIVDATFLTHFQRQIFVDLASRLHVHLQLLLFETPREILVRRIKARLENRQDVSEATEEVLALQLASLEPLTESEKKISYFIDYRIIDDLIRSKEN